MELSELFDKFVDEYNDGKEPQLEDYLCRCPSDENKFRNLIDLFLMGKHNLPSDIRNKSWQSFSESFFSDEIASLKQLESTTLTLGDALIYLSRQCEMPRETIVKALMNSLNLDTKNQGKVERFYWQYHRLENNFINPKLVSLRLLEAAADVFQIPVLYLEEAQKRSNYVQPTQAEEMKIAARVAEEREIYRERSHRAQPEEKFEEIDQLFIEVKDNAE